MRMHINYNSDINETKVQFAKLCFIISETIEQKYMIEQIDMNCVYDRKFMCSTDSIGEAFEILYGTYKELIE